jgi:hypothetical protein
MSALLVLVQTQRMVFPFKYFQMESTMSNEQQSTQNTVTPIQHSISFADMNGGQKAVFVCKVFVFLATGGFAFPTIFAD